MLHGRRTTDFVVLSLLLGTVSAGAARAQSYPLDSFDAPVPAQTVATSGPPNLGTDVAVMNARSPSIAGGVREAELAYGDAQGGVAHLTAGAGTLRMEQPGAPTAHIALRYGGFTRPDGPNVPGPLLALDLSNGQPALVLRFARVDHPLSIHATLFSNTPSDVHAPVFYAFGHRDVSPSTPGAPLVVRLSFDRVPGFGWSHVDGLAMGIYSSTSGGSSTYVLDALELAAGAPSTQPSTLSVRGNRIYLGDQVWVGRGANLFDPRANQSCDDKYYGQDLRRRTAYVKRLVDVLVDEWHANFIRIPLEAYTPADSALHDAPYLAALRDIVTHIGTKPGVFVALSPWMEPSKAYFEEDLTDPPSPALGIPSLSPALGAPPTEARQASPAAGYYTSDLLYKLVDTFALDRHVIWGLTNEPASNLQPTKDGDYRRDKEIWEQMSSMVSAIRQRERQRGAFEHLIMVQGTRRWSADPRYYARRPIADGNVAYEVHLYGEPQTLRDIVASAPQLPLILGEYGPEKEGRADLVRELQAVAETNQIPHAAWAFARKAGSPSSKPTDFATFNLLAPLETGCPAESDFITDPTGYGKIVKEHLAAP